MSVGECNVDYPAELGRSVGTTSARSNTAASASTSLRGGKAVSRRTGPATLASGSNARSPTPV